MVTALIFVGGRTEMATATMERKRACVTGATGYVGSMLVKSLLEKGYAVNATVRDPANSKKVSHLLNLQVLGVLKLFKADLTEEGSFDDAINGCDFVFHVATPVNFESEDQEGYGVSKTLSEKEAWKFAKENNLDIITVVPVGILGPSITPEAPGSVQMLLSLLTGNEIMVNILKSLQLISGSISLVHVEDVCRAHIFAAENESASGRYICCAVNTCVRELSKFLSKRYPQYNVITDFGDFPANLKSIFSSDKLIKAGFSYKYGIEEMYDESVEYLRAVGMLAN
ncbi:anthocyanidin reductase ((2S)-flavan-3-ol-forming)-like isoform X2 [Magnolia sinica]|uniref:anthocyanidin reductase ((2S)-flavan-3-ol-forming)-like isoform X2 n=1 Tax=Magnolia sinica TaxID=86752 RepID=UPI00265A7FA8|nr:anthocyanidin reductase ((2S)-flavan-3-ol-forming)-like isoform X2 [Magnolia sinica]